MATRRQRILKWYFISQAPEEKKGASQDDNSREERERESKLLEEREREREREMETERESVVAVVGPCGQLGVLVPPSTCISFTWHPISMTRR